MFQRNMTMSFPIGTLPKIFKEASTGLPNKGCALKNDSATSRDECDVFFAHNYKSDR